VDVVTAMVESLQDKMCRCNKSPRLVGEGTSGAPYELEYADEVVLPSPNPSSYATPPVENSAPIPTPAPASTLGPSDKENCVRCAEPVGRLVPIEDILVDKAEEESQAIEVRPARRGQRARRGRVGRMQASQPYFVPGGSDGDQSCGADTGGKGPNTHQVHCDYIVVTVNK
jgi:hypothetical protein